MAESRFGLGTSVQNGAFARTWFQTGPSVHLVQTCASSVSDVRGYKRAANGHKRAKKWHKRAENGRRRECALWGEILREEQLKVEPKAFMLKLARGSRRVAAVRTAGLGSIVISLSALDSANEHISVGASRGFCARQHAHTISSIASVPPARSAKRTARGRTG
eukprot:6208499-Pleurochrysis_carterae.AAC.1